MQRIVASILVVDDSEDIRGALEAYLGRHGFLVYSAESSEEARYLIDHKSPDLVILDIMMPGEDGISLCNHLRERYTTPIIMLSALKGDATKIRSLDIGADDYVVKPFSPRELLARINAALRRHPATDNIRDHVNHLTSGITHYPGRKTITFKSGKEVALTSGENNILIALMEEPGKIVSRTQMSRTLTDDGRPHTNRSIDNTISRLRKKLDDDARNPRIIITEWGGGYRVYGALGRNAT